MDPNTSLMPHTNTFVQAILKQKTVINKVLNEYVRIARPESLLQAYILVLNLLQYCAQLCL